MVNDGKLVSRGCAMGRGSRQGTLDKVRAYLAEHLPASLAPVRGEPSPSGKAAS